MVEDFQGEAYVPFIVLSVKAGGTGLNLTKANHVIHFDRWWNSVYYSAAAGYVMLLLVIFGVMV